MTQRQLKSFLGLASYFREHIEHFSDNVHELQAMIVPYMPSKKLSWTENTSQVFYKKFETWWLTAQNYIF